MYLRVYNSRDSSRQPAPSPSLCYLLTHAHITLPTPTLITITCTLDPPVSVFILSLYRHPFLYTLVSSLFTLILNNKRRSHTTCDKRFRVYTTVYGTPMDAVRFQNSSLSGIYLNHPGAQMESDQVRFLRAALLPSFPPCRCPLALHPFCSDGVLIFLPFL